MAQIEIVNNIRLNSGLKDKDGDLGTSGQILSSTGDSVNWIDSYSLTTGGDTGGPFNVTNSGQLFLFGGTGIKTTMTQPVAGSVDVDFSLEATGVTAGSYTSANITVDATGRITTASSGSGITGSGTTNYIPKFTGSGSIGNSPFTVGTSTRLAIPDYIEHIGDTTTAFGFSANGQMYFQTSGGAALLLDSTQAQVYRPAQFNDTLKYKTPTGTATTFNGEIVDFGSAALGVVTGNLVVLRHVSGSPQWQKADYNSALNATGMLGIYDGTNVLVRGFVQNSSFSFTTSGVPLYMGVTGAISTSAPVSPGDYVRIIGYVADAANDRIYFCPDNTWVLI